MTGWPLAVAQISVGLAAAAVQAQVFEEAVLEARDIEPVPGQLLAVGEVAVEAKVVARVPAESLALEMRAWEGALE